MKTLMFVRIHNDNNRHYQLVNLLSDTFPMWIHDGEEETLTSTREFLSDNDWSEECVDAVINMLRTSEPQAVGMGFTIRGY